MLRICRTARRRGGGDETLLSMKHGVISATFNLETPDPECDLDYTLKPAEHAVRVALSNSFGFGGQNACLLFQSIEEEVGFWDEPCQMTRCTPSMEKQASRMSFAIQFAGSSSTGYTAGFMTLQKQTLARYVAACPSAQTGGSLSSPAFYTLNTTQSLQAKGT